jgi:hypothetical protein
MPNKEPTYIIKWFAGILASVITTYLITNFITNNNSGSGPDIDTCRGVVPFEQKDGLLKFEYPVFLDKVTECGSSDKPFVTIKAVRSDLLQAVSRENISLFKRLTTLPPTIDKDKVGQVTVSLYPTYYVYLYVKKSKKKHSQLAPAEADIFEGLDPIARKRVDWNNLPSSGCTQKRTQRFVQLYYMYISYGVSLFVEGRFTKEAWSTHRSDIRRMLGSFSVNEVASVEWFRARLEDGSIKIKESKKLSEHLTAALDQQLSAHLQVEKAPDCIETQ